VRLLCVAEETGELFFRQVRADHCGEPTAAEGAHLSPTAAFWVLAAVPLGLMVYRRSLGEAVGTGGRGGDERWVIEAIARQQRSCSAAMPESPGYSPPGRALSVRARAIPVVLIRDG
jgi:hypothetical protein